ncbi:MAG: hypothetical protein KDA99_30270, partial [Planctomycetales bacterium]|nr:hypothetical protein [Planctomycetales bacterium]
DLFIRPGIVWSYVGPQMRQGKKWTFFGAKRVPDGRANVLGKNVAIFGNSIDGAIFTDYK